MASKGPLPPHLSEGEIQMTLKEAQATGWKITGRGSDWTAEKNRFIFNGPSKEFVLKLAETYDAKMSAMFA